MTSLRTYPWEHRWRRWRDHSHGNSPVPRRNALHRAKHPLHHLPGMLLLLPAILLMLLLLLPHLLLLLPDLLLLLLELLLIEHLLLPELVDS